MVDAAEVDARKATILIKNYLVHTYGPIVEFSFRLLSVTRNTLQDVWIVKCQVFASPKDAKPTEYEIKVNVKTGEIVKVTSQ